MKFSANLHWVYGLGGGGPASESDEDAELPEWRERWEPGF